MFCKLREDNIYNNWYKFYWYLKKNYNYKKKSYETKSLNPKTNKNLRTFWKMVIDFQIHFYIDKR